MQVTLINNVNIRQTPGTEFAPIGYYPIGTSISVSKIVSGQSIEGNLSWYQLDNGNYIWAGGTDTAQGANNFNINPNQWHLLQYSIPQLWQEFGCKGEGIKVAVIDTGIISSHQNYFGKNRVFVATSFSGTATCNDADLDDGHGSHCAGTIGANGSKDNLFGVAPACDMYIGKVYKDDFTTDDSFIAAAIDFYSIAPNCVDIISLSQGDDSVPDPVLSTAINKAISNPKGPIIVAAAGDDPSSANIYYPANTPPVISVGAIDSNNDTKHSTVSSDKVKIYGPGIGIYSIGLPEDSIPIMLSGTSQATPFIAGLMALGLQLLRKQTTSKLNSVDLANILISSSDIITDKSTGRTIHVINPINFLKQINSSKI